MEEEPPKEQIHPIVERLITLGFAKEDMGGAWEVAGVPLEVLAPNLAAKPAA
jgi:hypothetical protein